MPKNYDNKKCDIVLICVSGEIKLGIYENKKLTRIYAKNGKTSEILPLIFSEILGEFEISNIIYAKGPGNFSAIKLSYVFLQTLSIALNIRILAQDSFYFTNDNFINAYGKIHFEKVGDTIIPKVLEKPHKAEFILPEILHFGDFSHHCEPLYVLPAVG